MQAAGYRVEWREYTMAHQVYLEEVQDIGHWLAARLLSQGGG